MNSDFLTILFLMILIGVCILGMKYISGDFDPISIDVVDKYETNKTVVIIYKYTYKDGSVKQKIKKIKT